MLHEEIANVAPWKSKEKQAISCNGDKYKTEVDSCANRTDGEKSTGDILNNRLTGIKVTNATAKWSEDLNEDTLTDISVDVKTGSLVAVIGPVASGKV